MKQALDGIVYDTKTATLLGRNPPGFLDESRSLYRTPNGEFFSYEIIASSKLRDVEYDVHSGLSIKHYQQITPLTIEEAISAYYHLEERCMDFSEAFPCIDKKEGRTRDR